MGIRGLTTYIEKSVSNGHEQINMIREVETHKKKTNKPPLIVIDFMSFISLHGTNQLEDIFGGRFQVYEQKYHKFLSALKDAGAKLVFFVDGPRQAEKDGSWMRQANEKYVKYLGILDLMLPSKSAASIVQGIEYIPRISVYKREAQKLVGQYGEVKTAIYNECDVQIVDYAIRNDALAVMTDDSDYFIYKGDWQQWSTKSINTETMTTKRYNRHALRSHLGLNESQMAILATYCGNDLVSNDDVFPFLKSLGNLREKFRLVARRIISSGLSGGGAALATAMCKDIYKSRNPDAKQKQAIQDSLNFYNMVIQKDKIESNDLLRFALDTENWGMFFVVSGKVSNYTLPFEDLRSSSHNKSFVKIAEPMMRKVSGIYLQHKHDDQLKGKMCAKQTHHGDFMVVPITPDYPEDKLPDLKLFLSEPKEQDQYENLRFKLLCWIINSPKITPAVVKAMGKEYVMTVLALVYLIEQKELTIFEADIFLLTVNHMLLGKIPVDMPPPKYFNQRLVSKSFLFLKMLSQIKRALIAVRLQKFIDKIRFDGVYVHTLYAQYEKDKAVFGKLLKDVERIRYYKEEEDAAAQLLGKMILK